MNELLQNVGIVSATFVAFISAAFAMHKFFRTINPIKIMPSMYINLKEVNGDSISAKITNRSPENLYIVSCQVKEAKTVRKALLTHIKNPLIKPYLYPAVWFGGMTYNLLHEPQIKLEPGATTELTHELDLLHPIAGFSEPEFLVILKLSTGRVFRSGRLETPLCWHFSQVKKRA